jgi:hypothetical protein
LPFRNPVASRPPQAPRWWKELGLLFIRGKYFPILNSFLKADPMKEVLRPLVKTFPED